MIIECRFLPTIKVSQQILFQAHNLLRDAFTDFDIHAGVSQVWGSLYGNSSSAQQNFDQSIGVGKSYNGKSDNSYKYSPGQLRGSYGGSSQNSHAQNLSNKSEVTGSQNGSRPSSRAKEVKGNLMEKTPVFAPAAKAKSVNLSSERREPVCIPLETSHPSFVSPQYFHRF